MAKYFFEFKRKVVLAYLNREGKYRFFLNYIGFLLKEILNNGFIIDYQTFGDEDLLRSQKNDIYSFEKNFLV